MEPTDNAELLPAGRDELLPRAGLRKTRTLRFVPAPDIQHLILRAARYVLAQYIRTLINVEKDDDPVLELPGGTLDGSYIDDDWRVANYLLHRITPNTTDESEMDPQCFSTPYEEHVDRVFKIARLRRDHLRFDEELEAAVVDPRVRHNIQRFHLQTEDEIAEHRAMIRATQYSEMEKRATRLQACRPVDTRAAFDNLLVLNDPKGIPAHDVLYHALTLWQGPSDWTPREKQAPSDGKWWDKIDRSTDVSTPDFNDALGFLKYFATGILRVDGQRRPLDVGAASQTAQNMNAGGEPTAASACDL